MSNSYNELEKESILMFFKARVEATLKHFNDIKSEEFLNKVFTELIFSDMECFFRKNLMSDYETLNWIFILRNIFISMIDNEMGANSPRLQAIAKCNIIKWLIDTSSDTESLFEEIFDLNTEDFSQQWTIFEGSLANKQEFYFNNAFLAAIEVKHATDFYNNCFTTKEKYLDYDGDIDNISDSDFEKVRKNAFDNVTKLKDYSKKLREEIGQI